MYLAKRIYENMPEFLKGSHYENTTCTVSDTGVAADGEGRKSVPAGCLLDAGGNAVRVTRSGPAGSHVYTLSSEPAGILFDGADVTYGPRAGALMIDGSVNTERLQGEYLVEAVQQLVEKMPFIKFFVDGRLQTGKTV